MESLIKCLNEVYVSMKSNLEKAIKNKTSRLKIISRLNKVFSEESCQSNDTPEKIVMNLVNCIDDLEFKSILVLFNCEIVEYLVNERNVDPKNITYMTDMTEPEVACKASFVKSTYGIECIIFEKNVLFNKQKFSNKKFDVVFSNPPYNNNAHIKIFNKLIKESIATEYVIVHPANWLIDLKGKENLFVDFKQTISKKLKSVTMFNGNIVFDIGLHYPCVITHIDCNHCGIINVDYFGNKYTVNDINDISKYGKEWRAIVKPFFDTIKSNMPNGNVWNYKSENTTFNKVYCQIAGIRGHVNNRNKESFFLDDFYTLILKDLDSNKGIRKSDMPTFEFNSIIERDNFIDYLKTDFVRFCLSLFKINANLARGEMEIIPWLDFTEKWDDEKLFKYFNINNETQEYIREFLPDYYKIRN